MLVIKKILFLFTLINVFSFAQNTIMTYNILNYPGSDTTTRNPYFRTIFSNTQPDILVVQEIQSQTGVNGFLNNVLNSVTSGYAAGIFIDGDDTDNAIFYKSSVFNFISNIPIITELRDINEFTMRHLATGDTIRIYSLHLKASDTQSDREQRAREVDSLRKRTNALPSGSNFIVLGDFNIYSSSEPAFQKLLNQSAPGYVVDPLNLIGTWGNESFAPFQTQSPRTRSFGGGSTGGMDDRFDMILISQGLASPGDVNYVPGSTIAYGNDGNHYQDSINRSPNTAVGQTIANALHYAADHLPVMAAVSFDAAVFTLTSFTALIEGLFNGSVMIPDTVTIELRHSYAPYPLVEEKKVLLNQNGSGVSNFNSVANGIPYYLVVKHRSGLETWSAAGQAFSSNSMVYDFTTSSTKAYGSNMKLINGRWCMYSGDVNKDESINVNDLNQVYSSNVSGAAGYGATDLNGDLYTEIEDLNIVFRNSNPGINRQVPPGYSD